MRPLLVLSLAAATLTVASAMPAQADLVLGGTPTIPLAAAASTSSLPPVAAPASERRPVALPVAKGFGEQVSLRFAARQIVPSSLALAIADDVDANTTVTWQGDRPWNRVLQDVLKPLDLRLTITGKTALISR